MADSTKKIADTLLTATSVADADYLLIQNNSDHKKITYQNFSSRLNTVLDSHGTRLTTAEENITALTPYSNAGAHNSIYRGKSLGTVLSNAQATAISNGTFDDMFIGDYWTINSIVWRIAHFDYYLNCGDTNCTTHHVTVINDGTLGSAQMSYSPSGVYDASYNTTTGAYALSYFRNGTTVDSVDYPAPIITFREKFATAFGSAHVLSNRVLIANATSGGKESSWSWYDSTGELITELQAYGSRAWGGYANGYGVGTQNLQFRMFALNPASLHRRTTFWLQDVYSSTSFAYVLSYGNSDYPYFSSNRYGVVLACNIK